MIGEIEELAAELQITVFAEQGEALQQSKIEVRGARSDHDIASGITETSEETAAEVGTIEPLRRVMIEVVRICGYIRSRCRIRSSECRQPDLDINRVTGLECQDAVGLPSAQDLVSGPRPIRAESAAPAEGQVVNVTAGETVARVKRRQPTLSVKVENIEDCRIPGRAIIDGFRPRITGQEAQAFGGPLYQRKLKGVVGRGAVRRVDGDVAERIVGAIGLHK